MDEYTYCRYSRSRTLDPDFKLYFVNCGILDSSDDYNFCYKLMRHQNYGEDPTEANASFNDIVLR